MESGEFFALQGAVAGRYSLVREIGRGGMGIVFLALDVALDRPVAIKLLPPDLARTTAARERFLREARTAAGLSHPHIVPIHAVEEQAGLVFFVMGYVEGESVGERVRRAGPMPVREVMRMVQEVSWALGHAHARGIVHRDVKPDNILLERESGRALVTDFGIADRADRIASLPGAVAGTPAYMSPEQALGAEPDARADIYSLGVTAWFALTGRLPYDGVTSVALVRQHLHDPVPDLLHLAPRVPARLASLIARTMAKEPAQRPTDAAELAEGIAAVRGTTAPPIPAPIRAFLREAESAVREMGVMATAAGVTGGLAIALRLFASGLNQSILSSVFGLAMVLAGGAGAVRLGQLIEAARTLLRQGYDHRALAAATATARDEQAEEREIGRAMQPRSRREELGLVAVGILKSAVLIAVPIASWGPGWLQGLALVGAVVVPTVTIRKAWQMIRPNRGGWLKALSGRAGSVLLRLSGIGLGTRRAPPALAAGESTVVALGGDAEALFKALAPADRAQLQEVGPLLLRLRVEAEELHRAADLPGAQERLATVVAALETLRLDLLRVRAGSLRAGELTEQIEAVVNVHARIEGQANAESEVHRLLQGLDKTPDPIRTS